MDKETGKPALDVNGNKITAEASFTAKEKSGSVEVTFVFDGSNLDGSTLVVFEDLKKGDKLYASHADINDEAQTIYVPKIGTQAIDAESGTQNALADEKVTIVDTVSYANLIPGKEYTIKGTLMNKETGKAILVKDQEVTAETTFIPEKSSGVAEVTFVFDGTGFAGRTLVVFEELLLEGRKVAVHADIEDEDQTIYFPKIGTTATVNGEHSAEAARSVTITDAVEYKNLIPGQAYKVSGILMDKATGKAIQIDGKEVTAEAKFTPEQSSGTVNVDFTFDASNLEGKEIVVFEKLHTADTKIADHEDLNDKGQTVAIKAKGKINTSSSGNTKNGSGVKSVKTADTTPIFIWLGILIVSGLFLGGYIYKRKKKGLKH